MTRQAIAGTVLALLLLSGCSNRQSTAAASASPTVQVPTFYQPLGVQSAGIAGPIGPRYPDSLRIARVEGEALVMFVVDTSGRMLRGSMRVVRASDTAFVAGIRSALSEATFTPATMNGRAIRQLVQMPFFFDVSGSARSRARRPLPVARPTTDSTVRTPMQFPAVVVTVP